MDIQRYEVGGNYGEGYCDAHVEGEWVRHTEHEQVVYAQRLRADTAEAESVASHQREARLQEMVNDLSDDLHLTAEERDHAKRNSSAFEERMGVLQVANGKLQEKLAAAEQRIAELKGLLRSASEELHDFITGSLLDRIDAALNPNPEAESHG